MPIKKIQNVEQQEALRIKEWIGWKVGWLTGWYNPFDRLSEVVNPRELGELVRLQGEFMRTQGQLVQDLGSKLGEFTKRVNLNQ